MILIYLGKKHYSSEVHEMVIKGLEYEGKESTKLEKLRTFPINAKKTLIENDFETLGAIHD